MISFKKVSMSLATLLITISGACASATAGDDDQRDVIESNLRKEVMKRPIDTADYLEANFQQQLGYYPDNRFIVSWDGLKSCYSNQSLGTSENEVVRKRALSAYSLFLNYSQNLSIFYFGSTKFPVTALKRFFDERGGPIELKDRGDGTEFYCDGLKRCVEELFPDGVVIYVRGGIQDADEEDAVSAAVAAPAPTSGGASS